MPKRLFETLSTKRRLFADSKIDAERIAKEPVQALLSICLLVSPQDDTHPIIKVTKPNEFNMNVGRQWGTACRKRLPPAQATPCPEAATCYDCLKWLKQKRTPSLPETQGVKGEKKLPEESSDSYGDDVVVEEVT